ncbi:DUF433 domain-containing protein [Romeria aff. gracilis LEGE 07310]|uniref:DUF433 domain-containing protein n=1 Tax=Vasconcelosia minhoensis LEGE 07310 TaxID=915328 RepID=A0A8J7DNI7_9CYAN|nr:DUF433 domain-containing protein [Romeria gracilis]MBE9080076.1 DUF433 domain-containing protein [Romeria aff. gracilis LEGE 07310]
MEESFEQASAIIRTDWGLTISGTRITIYDVMDYLTAGYPDNLIREKLCLTDEQTESALSYITAHQAEVAAEYQQVLQIAEKSRQYWEKYNRDRVSNSSEMPDRPTQAALRAKLQAWKDRLEAREGAGRLYIP